MAIQLFHCYLRSSCTHRFIIWEIVFKKLNMKFFSNLLAIVNLACAKQGFSGQHMRHKTVHYDSYKHGSFHDYFAHALSVMRYYYQKRGRKSDFCKSEMFIFFRNQSDCRWMFKLFAYERRIVFASVIWWWLLLVIIYVT